MITGVSAGGPQSLCVPRGCVFDGKLHVCHHNAWSQYGELCVWNTIHCDQLLIWIGHPYCCILVPSCFLQTAGHQCLQCM